MNKFFFLVAIIMVTLSFGENDVRFYNLEKEYKETNTLVYKVKKAKALELKQILGNMLSIYGTLYVNEESNEIYITDVREKIDDIKPILEKLDNEGVLAGNNLVTERLNLKHVKSSDVYRLIKHKLSAEGTIFDVSYLNALVVTDVPSKISEVKSFLEKVDIPVKHISIEISVIEFNNEAFSRLGLNIFNWLQGLSIQTQFHGGDDILLKNIGDIVVHSDNTGVNDYKNFMTDAEKEQVYHLKAQFSIRDIIDFIKENADGTVLANTRIVTSNNKEASISSREIIPFRMAESPSYYDNKYENAAISGMSVRVLPTVGGDSLINLRIYPVISNLSGWSPKGMPIVFQRSVNTEVKVRDNTIFVLGGLKKQEVVKVRKGIPGLKEIPGIRWLFSSEKNVNIEREILIFIRPTTNPENMIDGNSYKNMLEKYKNSSQKKRDKRREKKKRKKE